AVPRRAVPASVRAGRADRRGSGLRAHRLLLRAGHARGDQGRSGGAGARGEPRRPAPAHPRPDGPLPGLLLRRRSCGAARRGGPELTSPEGRDALRAAAIVLATGCRERPRSARLVPGSRPEGVMTTGTLQQLVELQGERVGTRAVVVGAEHVSFSAVLTLAHA